MKNLIYRICVFISIIYTLSLPLYAQARKGYITSNSSLAQCRQYFKDNILLLDPIEGIYNVQIVGRGYNAYGELTPSTNNFTWVIHKRPSGTFGMRGNYSVEIKRIGETNAYNYSIKWPDINFIDTKRIVLQNNVHFNVQHDVPQAQMKHDMGRNYTWQIEIFSLDFIKEYPTGSMYEDAIEAELSKRQEQQEKVTDWSGSGFALNNGYICTNYHVIDGAKSIEIRGIQGDFTTSYSAKAVASDKFNDLSILKIDDADFKGFGTIPYKVKTLMADVGEEIFVLGYPMTATMGDEIKLTTGVVSSRTGFQGDVSLYQISAPIQPGNSGGPLFDSQGNLIGIISAKHKGAENVGYAIKASYLKNLMESSLIEDILPINNTISSLPLTGKVQKVKNYVYFIKCSSKSNSISTNNNHDISSYTDEDSMTYYSSNTISDSTGTRVNATAYKIPDAYESEAESDNSEALISSGMKLAMEDSVHYTPDKDTVNNPYVKTVIDKMAIIKRVIRKDDFTAVEISIKRGKRQWCNINEDTYIEADGIRYTMTCADGIATAPEKTYFPYTEDSVTFTLFFPPIPKSAVSMHLIESTYSDFRFYGIQLR